MEDLKENDQRESYTGVIYKQTKKNFKPDVLRDLTYTECTKGK